MPSLSPKQRLARAREILAKESPEQWDREIPKLFDPDAPIRVGKVTITDSQRGTRQVGWKDSAVGEDGELQDVRFRAPADTWADLRKVRERAPLERVESLVKRYIAEWQRGNTQIIDQVGREICGEYWKMGAPLSETKLRELAKASLEQAENKRKRDFHKKTTKPWAVK